MASTPEPPRYSGGPIGEEWCQDREADLDTRIADPVPQPQHHPTHADPPEKLASKNGGKHADRSAEGKCASFPGDLISLGLTFSIGRRLLPAAPWVLPGAYVLITFAQPYLAYDALDIVLTTFFLLSIDCWLRSLDDIPTANRWATASYLLRYGDQLQADAAHLRPLSAAGRLLGRR